MTRLTLLGFLLFLVGGLVNTACLRDSCATTRPQELRAVGAPRVDTPASATIDEAQATAIATAHLRQRGTLYADYECRASKHASGWSVFFARLPRRPGNHQSVIVSHDAEVVTVYPGR